ncbi:MAG: hypothetical protein GXO23_03950 [Crenarchaeota archaeon]|nr:hypothetical protein [Thermoproteota archaeon]
MSEYANMYVALTIDHVDEEYITKTLTELKIPRLRIPTQITETDVYTVGQGESILVLSGFSLYDYKIVNSLTLYLASQYSGVRALRALPSRLLEQRRLLIYPIANKYSYVRHIVKTRNYKRSIMDEDGIEVLKDSLTLRSCYSKIMHSLVKNTRPGMLIVFTTDRSLGIELEEPVLNMVENKHSKVEINIPVINVLHHTDQILQMPHSHHALENDVSLGMMVVIPFGYALPETYNLILRVVEQALKARIERKEVENRPHVARIRVLSDRDDVVTTLRQHGLEISHEGSDEISVVYDRAVELHVRLIEEQEIEYYFNVKVLS